MRGRNESPLVYIPPMNSDPLVLTHGIDNWELEIFRSGG